MKSFATHNLTFYVELFWTNSTLVRRRFYFQGEGG